MKIKKLDICGFKSFVDRTVIQFDRDVTGIVGPNGCGKSNVVDAMKWVMGEQSASRLRGKGMEDVIFGGSESRPPHGFAEVSITFDNSEGLAPPEYRDYAEICVTRRLDRQGRSDYKINGTAVRLLDVTNLFLGTGIGKRAYSIIEQGRVGFIVSSKPEDRRHIIEEAAGITKFKARKKAAERKMDRTRDNLLRVNDVLQEISRNLDSLKRQAAKAERYKRYRGELRDLELYISTHKYLELFAELRYARQALDAAREELGAKRTELDSQDAALEGERASVLEAETAVRDLQERAHEVDSRIRTLEGEAGQALERLKSLREQASTFGRDLNESREQAASYLAEKQEAEAHLEGLKETKANTQESLDEASRNFEHERELAREAEMLLAQSRQASQELQTKVVRAEATLEGHAQRQRESLEREQRAEGELSGLLGERSSFEGGAKELAERKAELESDEAQAKAAREELAQRLDHERVALKESERVLEAARSEAQAARSRLQSLEEIRERFEGVGEGVKGLMTAYSGDAETRRARGIEGLVADFLDCPEEYGSALAGVLGDGLQHVVVSGYEHAVAAFRFLREESRGRAEMVVAGALPEAALRESEDFSGREGVVGALRSYVQPSPGKEHLADALLANVWVVENLEVAASILRSTGGASPQPIFVTRQGDVLDGRGRASGGPGDDAGTHLLEMKRQVEGLREKVAELDARLSEAHAAHEQGRERLRQTQEGLEEQRSRAHALEVERVSVAGALAKEEQRLEQQQKRIEQLRGNIEELRAARETTAEAEREAREHIEALRADQAHAAEELAEAEQRFEQARDAVQSASQIHTEARVHAAEAAQQATTVQEAVNRLARSVAELESRAARASQEQKAALTGQIEVMARMWQLKVDLYEGLADAKEAHAALDDATRMYEERRHALSELEEGVRAARSGVDAVAERLGGLEMRARELELSIAHLQEQTESRHRVAVQDILQEHHHKAVPDENVHARVDELTRLIDRMGEINLTAIEEYEEKSQRHAFLSAQKQDLEDALDQLDKAIAQMNRESRKRFREAFDAVSERFRDVFPRMFGGGRAELKLTNPEDLLETGIDIVAQPPGKKLGSLELMSGGEKALTAVSLIFAIFQYKPSPFCLLDEVDAPLDEANIGRFSTAVQQMTDRSQFIIITHSKRTMEAADVLCGVTMEQPGVSKLVSVELRREQERAVA